MSDNPQGNVGDVPAPVGDSGKDSEKSEYVKRSAFDEVLDETKKFKSKFRETQAELNELRARQKEAEEAKLLEEKNYQEVIDRLRQEKEQILNENQLHVKEKQDFRKMSSLLSSLQKKGINIESKYYDLLPMDKIGFDDDGNIDGTSLADATETFIKEHPRLTTPIGKLLPNQKPESGGPKMSVSEWKNLGSRKERQEALAKGLVKM